MPLVLLAAWWAVAAVACAAGPLYDHFAGVQAQGRATTRQLLQDSQEPVYVSTPRELESVILQGRQHIVITAHLDLTSLPVRETSICLNGCGSPLPEIRLTLSIRGNCTTPPADNDVAILTRTPQAVALLPVQPGQCLLFGHDDLFPIVSFRMWLDNVYLRAVAVNPPTPDRRYHFIGLAGSAAARWPLRGHARRFLTRVTLQGDGLGPTTGLWADEPSYAENCTFANLGGDAFLTGGCHDCSAAVNAVNTSVSLANCTFFEPAPLNGTAYVRVFRGGRVRISGCQFAPAPGLQLSPFVALPNTSAFSDDASLAFRDDLGSTSPPQPLAAAPQLPLASPMAFLTRDDDWFAAVQEDLNVTRAAPAPAYTPPAEPLPRLGGPQQTPPPAPRAPPSVAGWPDPTNTQSQSAPSSTHSAPSGPAVAALAAVIALLMLCTVILAACLLWRRTGMRTDAAPQAAPAVMLAYQGAVPGAGEGIAAAAADHVGPQHAPQAEPPLLPPGLALIDGSTLGAPVGKATHGAVPQGSTGGGRCAVSSGPAPDLQRGASARHAAPAAAPRLHSAPPAVGPPGAALDMQLTFLQAQLESLPPGQVVAGRYALLGAPHRRQGGHSVVAFAKGAYDHRGYAVKFYATLSAFDTQWAMSQLPALEALTPRAHAAVDAQQAAQELRDATGRPLPPCIVMERGESLDEWSLRAKPDVFQSVAVLAHVAACLRDMHAAGYVHQDVKPSNIMLLPRENRWTVADLSTAAVIGCEVSIVGAQECKSPEAAAAVAYGAVTAAASPAQDAWALGIVAFELLTRRPALHCGKGSLVQAQLQGHEPLPWEGNGLPLPVCRDLGVFHDPVLMLLCQDPRYRSSLRNFCDACNGFVQETTTLAVPAY